LEKSTQEEEEESFFGKLSKKGEKHFLNFDSKNNTE
jgi:hypothetical protein